MQVAHSGLYDRQMGAESELSAFILAGGKSTRMGADKAFVLLNGRSLLARALDTLRSLTPKVQIVGNPDKFRAFAPVVQDIFPNCGPLGGIHAALRFSADELNVILAVDTPFVSLALLQFMVARAGSSPGLVTVARANGLLQPLCGIYRRGFADVAEKALRSGCNKIDAAFDTTSTQEIAEQELSDAGFLPAIFRNLNTPDELAQAQR